VGSASSSTSCAQHQQAELKKKYQFYQQLLAGIIEQSLPASEGRGSGPSVSEIVADAL
jgi:hypothetical protein